MPDNIVFFDGVCNLCSGLVQFLIKHNKKQNLLFAPLQGETAREFLNETWIQDLNTIVYCHKGKFYFKSTAVLMLAKELDFPYKFLAVFLLFPQGLRNAVYNWVARNRYQWYGKKNECWLPSEELMLRFKK